MVHPMLFDDKPDYSHVIPCRAPSCFEEQKSHYLTTDDYIRDVMKDKGVSKFHTFENFKVVPGVEEVLEAFRDIAFDIGALPLLLVYGKTGNGKSHLCEATVIQLSRRGVDCHLWSVADMVSKLHASIPENTTEQMVSNLKTIPALILDEWGQNYGSLWEEQKLEEIVIAREREGLITIITTNLELDKFPDRIISRFRDRTQARAILNQAPDYRTKKKAKKDTIS